MRRTFYASTLALALVTVAVVAAALAQTAGAQNTRGAARTTAARPAQARTTAAAQTVAPLPLPASDALLTVDVRRLLTEVVPRALASDSARLAQVNADVEEFRTKTGINARDFDTASAG